MMSGPAITADLPPEDRVIYRWLRDEAQAPQLADLFAGAVDILRYKNFPGATVLVSHAVREIANRLPDYLSKETVGARFDYTTRVRELYEVWTRGGLPIETDMPEGAGLQYVPMPVHVFRMIQKILDGHRQASERARRRENILFQAVWPECGQSETLVATALTLWRRTVGWFKKRRLACGPGKYRPETDELRRQFDIFKTILLTLAQPQTKTMDKIDEILQEANG